MIHVCDAIMGSGKSQSAIAYMNAHPHTKFIYISPYKDDGPVIKARCPDLNFVVPAKLPNFGLSKTEHCRSLLEHGSNIACTHELFKRYDREILDMIRSQHYTIIIDEEVDVLEECAMASDDIDLLEIGGYVEKDGEGNITQLEKEYKGELYKDFFYMLRNRKLECCCVAGNETKYFYWQLPPDLLQAFDEVFILTYLFDCQGIRYMLDMYGMEYDHIYIKRTAGGGYAFSETPSYLPEYVSHITDMIEIYEGDNLNEIGNKVNNECPLSMNWFNSKKEERADVLKNNLYNYFRFYTDARSDEKLWATYNSAEGKIKGKGYSSGFLVFNKKGSNEFRHKKALAYCVNLYVSPQTKNYYAKYGITPDEDARALSIMIQWIWRSAIRDGQKIQIYIPSERMRTLLKDWMAKIEADAKSGRWAQHGQQFEMAS